MSAADASGIRRLEGCGGAAGETPRLIRQAPQVGAGGRAAAPPLLASRGGARRRAGRRGARRRRRGRARLRQLWALGWRKGVSNTPGLYVGLTKRKLVPRQPARRRRGGRSPCRRRQNLARRCDATGTQACSGASDKKLLTGREAFDSVTIRATGVSTRTRRCRSGAEPLGAHEGENQATKVGALGGYARAYMTRAPGGTAPAKPYSSCAFRGKAETALRAGSLGDARLAEVSTQASSRVTQQTD